METNSRALKIQRRKKFSIDKEIYCEICKPNRGCNSKPNRFKRNHGQKPRYKDKR